MTQTEALRLALEALEYFTDTSSSAMDKAMAEDAITAIKAALEAKDEPVAWFCKERNLVEIDCPAEDDFRSTLGWEPLYTTPPQRKPEQEQRNVTEQEHDVLMNSIKASSTVVFKGFLAQPEQEPVAIADGTFNHNCPVGTPLYTTPPQRKPLSYEDLIECEQLAGIRHRIHMGSIRGQQLSPADEFLWHYARAIEAAHNIKGEA
jgi:hypothetical protein